MSLARGILVTTNKLESVLNCLLQLDILVPTLLDPLPPTTEDIGDDRLSIARELLKTEDTYLENLRNIFDVYMEPLK